MKYNCEVVRDLMPLWLDDAASEASKKVVLEHMSECNQCVSHYEILSKDIEVEDNEQEPVNKYTELAKQLKRQRRIRNAIFAVLATLFVGLCLNYAVGYRLTSRKAADLCGSLTWESKVMDSYQWENYMFYFYDSKSCYDVVLTERTWHGWKAIRTTLNWPKWYLDPESRVDGMEMAGAEWFVSYDHGIQVFPFISWDEKVKRVEATVFGLTKSTEVETGKFTLLTFEDSKGNHQGNADATATAYDADGKPLYTLASERGYWMWKKVE